jgi:hypothetical protein
VGQLHSSCLALPIVVLALVLGPPGLVGQTGLHWSGELGLGPTYSGNGLGFGGKFTVRATPGTWGFGVRHMVFDGARRTVPSCELNCRPIASFWERSLLAFRRISTSNGAQVVLGAGIGQLQRQRFIGSTTQFDRDVSELSLSFEPSFYFPREDGLFRFATSANGHVGSGGLSFQLGIGVALSG